MTNQEVIDLLSKAVLNGGYPCPSGVIGQIILEVGWSLKTPKDYKTGKESYNLGNIKGDGPAGYVTIITTEYYNYDNMNKAKLKGELISYEPYGDKFKCQVIAKFRAYNNYTEALKDHLSFLKGDRYQKAGVLNATTPEDYANALYKAGYATDPNYASKIISIVDRYNLRQYDKKENPKPVETNATTYTVIKGDTLWAISQKFGVSVDQIKKLNGLTSNVLSIGQVLKIKEDPTITYTVVKGDTLWGISKKFETSVDKIKQFNNLKTDVLSIGQVLRIQK